MKIHHIGFVVANINEKIKNILYKEEISRVYDPIQDANLILLSANEGSFIELIEPKSERSFTWNFLKKNGDSFHHICYEMNNLSDIDEVIKNNRMIKVLGPVNAKLFNRDVVFAVQRDKSIVEFLL